jgi:hypothetical protein
MHAQNNRCASLQKRIIFIDETGAKRATAKRGAWVLIGSRPGSAFWARGGIETPIFSGDVRIINMVDMCTIKTHGEN